MITLTEDYYIKKLNLSDKLICTSKWSTYLIGCGALRGFYAIISRKDNNFESHNMWFTRKSHWKSAVAADQELSWKVANLIGTMSVVVVDNQLPSSTKSLLTKFEPWVGALFPSAIHHYEKILANPMSKENVLGCRWNSCKLPNAGTSALTNKPATINKATKL